MVKNEHTKVFAGLTKVLGSSKVQKTKAADKFIVKPKTSDDVTKIIRIAVKDEVPIVPERSAGLVGDDTSTKGCIILSTANMSEISEIDEENLFVTVEPGVTWKKLYKTLNKKKHSIGAYPGALAPTVGEWINSGGAGIGSYKFGSAEDQVRSLEVVLPDGNIINTGFRKVLSNSSGYNLNGLFVGADGTLGVITKVTLKMVPISEETRSLSYTFADINGLKGAVHDLTRLKASPLDISFFDRNHFMFLRSLKKDVQVPKGTVMNITLSGQKTVLAHDERVIDTVMNKHGAVRETDQIAQMLWKERFFDITSKKKESKTVFCEALIPASKLLEMFSKTTSLINDMKLKAAITGAICDRSTVSFRPYFILSGKSTSPPKAFIEKFGELAFKHGGRPLGLNLKRVYGEGMDTILDIKSTIDPHNIMNPQRTK